MEQKYNVIIVDDEFPARALLSEYVSKIPSLNLLAACSNVVGALKEMSSSHADILILDIQMPEITGLEFAKTLENRAGVIFTTAYSDFAVDAFSIGAADYLLKPFSFDRFKQAIEKAASMLSAQNNEKEVESTTVSRPEREFIMVKADYKLYKINYDDILYIEGQHEYVTFHTKQQRITALFSLKDLQSMLPSTRFVRIHKSYIISLDHIQDIEKNSVTVAGTQLTIGGNHRDELMRLLGQN